MRDPAFRCSLASRELEEPLLGTASTVSRFLLVEAPGPWGVSALRDSRLPDEVKRHLAAVQAQERLRPLLIRRPAGVPRSPGVRVYLADARSRRLSGTVLDDVAQLPGLDLDALAPVTGPLFAVCTHGRHDACCAELGRPLAAAVAAVDPERTWEVSHIGGDRFAPNLLVLPGGWYYGRLDPQGRGGLRGSAHAAGRVDPTHLRGRSALPMPVQAAEVHLRRELAELGEDAVTHVGTRREGADRLVTLMVEAEAWEVRVRPRPRPARRLTCSATGESESVDWELVTVTAPTAEQVDNASFRLL